MSILKHIEPVSAMKLGGVLYSLVGFLVGLICTLVSFLALFSSGIRDSLGIPGVGGAVLGLFGVVAFPILYAVIGGLGAALMSLLYNFAARFVGGLVVELE